MIYKVTLVLCVAAIVATALRRSSASLRHMVWMLALGVALALPLAGLWMPPVALPAGLRFVTDAGQRVAGPAGFDWLRYVWMAGAAVAALRFAVAHFRARRLVSGAMPAGQEQGVEVRRAPDGVMPLTWGLLRAVILLPDDAAREVRLHELAHAHRRDHWWLLVSQAACSLYWFHPLVWVAARQAAAERERACDDWALTNGAAPQTYAETLLDAARSRLAVPSAAMAVAGQTPLEARLRSILDPATNRRGVSRWMVASAAVVALAVMLPMASAQKVYKMSDGIVPPTLVSKVEPDYTDEARDAKISGSVVLSIEIDEEGAPLNVSVTRALDAGLDKNAIIAVEKWRFKPATKDGKAVRCAATVEVNFRLE